MAFSLARRYALACAPLLERLRTEGGVGFLCVVVDHLQHTTNIQACTAILDKVTAADPLCCISACV